VRAADFIPRRKMDLAIMTQTSRVMAGPTSGETPSPPLLPPSPKRFFRSIIVGLIACLGLTGCRLWGDPPAGPQGAITLSPIVPSREGIELRIAWVRRPVADPSLGESLWSSLNQVSCSDILRRDRLLKSGIRYGIAGTHPPESLAALIDQRYETPSHRDTYFKNPTVESGWETELETWCYPDGCVIEVNGQPRELQNARCMMRIRAETTQEGWATLKFTPEIHHGAAAGRYMADDLGFRYQDAQGVIPLYDHEFSVDLNVGESVVIGPAGRPLPSLGSHFFHGGSDDYASQALLIVQLSDLRRVDPVHVARP
jgi:hypothetical protein